MCSGVIQRQRTENVTAYAATSSVKGLFPTLPRSR